MRLKNAIAAACLGIFGLALADASQETIKQPTNIPPQALGAALQILAKERKFQIIYAYDELQNLRTAGAVGQLSSREALEQLLRYTGLTYKYLDEQTVTIVPLKREASASSPIAVAENDYNLSLAQAVSENSQTAASTAAANEPSTQNPNTAQDSSEQSSDSAANKIQEIVVTAQKREERLIDVPMSITAISGENLTEAGITNISDLSRVVPSLTVNESGPGRQQIAIRGLNTIRGNSSLTGVYLDEIPLSGTQNGFVAAYADLRVIDLDRVEVLKGPQGTLFGEGAAGGVVRFITKDPDLGRVGGEISTEFSNTADGDWSGKMVGVGNFPLVTDVFGVRVAATYENASGWIDQPSIDRENINDSELWHVRAKALYTPIPQLQVKGLIEIHRNDGGASNVINQEPFDHSNFRQAVFLDAPTGWRDEYEIYNLTATYDFAFAELSSSTSYYTANSDQSFTQLEQGAGSAPWLEILLSDFLLDSSNTSQEFRLTSTSEGPLKWTAGAAYKDSKTRLDYGEGCFDSNFFGGAIQFRRAFCSKYTNKMSQWAGFGDVSYQLTDRLSMGGGLRYFHGQQEQIAVTPNSYTVSGDADRLTWRAYGQFEAAKDVNLYFNIGTGFRSGGFNYPNQIPLGAPPTYGEETALFYELGVKTVLFDGRVRLDSAVYYGEWNGMQSDFAQLLPNGFFLQYTSNGQDARIKGVEAEISWATTDRLTLTLAGDLTDAEITWVDPANLIPGAQEGESITAVPDYRLSAGAEYHLQWSPSVPGSVLLNYSQIGRTYAGRRDVGNGLEEYFIPEVAFLTARVGAQWSGWRWSLFGTNLLDERKISSAYLLFSSQARPRTVGVSVSKAF